MNTIEKIAAVKNAMATVSVAGPENWNKMLASWQTLCQVEEELKHESTEASIQQRNSEDAADHV